MNTSGLKRARSDRKTVPTVSAQARLRPPLATATVAAAGAAKPLVFLPTLQGARANARLLPAALEDHVCDHLSFGSLFALYALCRGAAAAADGLWARKRHLRCQNESWDVLPAAGAQAYWAAVGRCKGLATIVIGHGNVDDAVGTLALLRRHAPTLQHLELCEKGGLADVVRQCSRLHTLRLHYCLEAAERKALAEALPESCPHLRALRWEGALQMRTTGCLLARLAAAGVRLEELELVGACHPALLAPLSDHPLRVLRIDDLAGRTATPCCARVALPAALLKLQPTLTDLHLGYDSGITYARIALPLWGGLRRLHVEGDVDVAAAAPSDAAASLRHLSLSHYATYDWGAAETRGDLRRLRTLHVRGAGAGPFAAAVRSVARHGGFLPALRSLSCDGDVSLDRVLALWPELVALQAPCVARDISEPPPPVARHAHLRRLSVSSAHPVVGRWTFSNLAELDLALPAGDAKPVAGWQLLLRCLAASAPTIRRLTFNRVRPSDGDAAAAAVATVATAATTVAAVTTAPTAATSPSNRHSATRSAPSERTAVTAATAPSDVEARGPIAFPRLQHAEFGLEFDASRREISAILQRAPSLTRLHVRAARDGAGMLVWLAALGARGALARLHRLHYATSKPPGFHAEREAHLRRAVPALRSCHSGTLPASTRR